MDYEIINSIMQAPDRQNEVESFGPCYFNDIHEKKYIYTSESVGYRYIQELLYSYCYRINGLDVWINEDSTELTDGYIWQTNIPIKCMYQGYAPIGCTCVGGNEWIEQIV
jgi:hypothetical protein